MKPPMLSRRATSTGVIFVGLSITYIVLPDADVGTIFLVAACGAGASIALGVLLEIGSNIRRIIRVDLLMIVALYGLTLVEFLFPQKAENLLMSPVAAINGVEALFIGFVGLAGGRLFVSQGGPRNTDVQRVANVGTSTVFRLYVLLFIFSYLNMLLAVSFDPIELVRQMLQPRFSQPWSRGSLGGVETILGELSNLALYLVPAVAGAALGDRKYFNPFQVAFIVFGLLFTLFYGFASGTRNTFAIYLLMAVGSYTLRCEKLGAEATLIGGAAIAFILYLSAYYMLQFRTVGLAEYWETGGHGTGYREETLFVDYNLPVISLLTEIFPDRYQYLGFEVVYFALVRPIPRALWPGKPEGVSVETADALGLSGLTVSSTFVGEAYTMAGCFGVLTIALFFGAFGGWWEKRHRNFQSQLTLALYVSGFFAPLISMRSLYWFTTALLPTVGIWLYLQYRRSWGERGGRGRERGNF